MLNYYQDILEALHPTEVADKMLRKGLLNASTFKMISNAPCDYIGNKIIIEKLRQRDTSGLFMFLDILQEIGNYGIIHSALMNGKSGMHDVSQYFNCYMYMENFLLHGYHIPKLVKFNQLKVPSKVYVTIREALRNIYI